MAVASSPRLLVLHALRLRGVAEPEAIAAYVGIDRAAVDGVVPELLAEGLVVERKGRFPGFSLTDDGRAEDDRLLAEELEGNGLRPRVEGAYDEFLGFNRQLLDVCTQWQLRTDGAQTVTNDHRDADHDRAVIDALVSLHRHARPVLASLREALDRFTGHDERLQYALDRVAAGEHDWFTKPMFPSYHSCWFELHEDLLATLGRERHREGSP